MVAQRPKPPELIVQRVGQIDQGAEAFVDKDEGEVRKVLERWVGHHRSGVVVNERIIERVEVGSIVIRCFEYERMFAFWHAALGYEVEHTDPNGGFVILGDPARVGPNISIDQAPTRRTGKRSWLHLDLYTANQLDEVERLVELGARRYPWRYNPGADYVVLEDPDGNLFCVVEVADDY